MYIFLKSWYNVSIRISLIRIIMKVAVLISGGVDSSVALKLLKEQGHDLTAFYLKIWLEDELSFLGDCPWDEDLSYVTKVCEKLEIPLQIIPLQKEYLEQVVKYTIAEIKEGRTPNPDVLCNSRIKFGIFYKNIDSSFEKIATGHYAQVEHSDKEGFKLVASADSFKDQTYFLANLTQEQVARCLFPIGHLTKSQVRELAQEFDLPNKQRKDSQGLCFLGKIKFKEFVKAQIGTINGEIREFETFKKLGSHEGYWFYTIGQRQGIGLSGGPWYVVSKDIKANIVYVSKNYYCEEKIRNQFKVNSFNWISGQKPKFNELQVKLRHGQAIYNCRLEFESEYNANVIIDSNDQGIAAGQFAVFYKDNICLGSGIISS
jgi:tRNA-5-taurinomethyluridine 2-sulfurtransferase